MEHGHTNATGSRGGGRSGLRCYGRPEIWGRQRDASRLVGNRPRHTPMRSSSEGCAAAKAPPPNVQLSCQVPIEAANAMLELARPDSASPHVLVEIRQFGGAFAQRNPKYPAHCATGKQGSPKTTLPQYWRNYPPLPATSIRSMYSGSGRCQRGRLGVGLSRQPPGECLAQPAHSPQRSRP